MIRLIEVRNKRHGNQLISCLQHTPENWAIQVLLDFSHSTQPLSFLHVSPYGAFFWTHPHIPLICKIIFPRNKVPDRPAQICSVITLHSLYQYIDLIPSFDSLILKPMSI